MNKYILSISTLLLLLFISSCEEPANKETEYEYHAHITSPSSDDKHMNDSIHISIDFESHSGETIHHINVRIVEKDSGTEVYNKPESAHIHTEGSYLYHDHISLNGENGFNAHTDYILEAKIWGPDTGVQEVAETLEFHVHPE